MLRCRPEKELEGEQVPCLRAQDANRSHDQGLPPTDHGWIIELSTRG